MIGTLLGCIPTMLAVVFIYKYFQDPSEGGMMCSATPSSTPSVFCLENIPDFQLSILGSDDAIINYRNGRKMLMLVAVGVYCVFITSTIIYPNYTKADMITDAQRLKDKYEPLLICKKLKIYLE